MRLRRLLALFVSVCVPAARAEGIVLWRLDLPGDSVLSLEEVAGGRYLASVTGAAREYTPTSSTSATQEWTFDLSAWRTRRAANGNTLIAEKSRSIVAEVALPSSPGSTVWTFGQLDTPGCSADNLTNPSDLSKTANGDYLITDSGNNRILRISPAGAEIWRYGRFDCAPEPGADGMNNPQRAIELANGNVLVTVAGYNTVVEIQPIFPNGGTVVRRYGDQTAGAALHQLRTPMDAIEVAGTWLIADYDNNRLVQVVPETFGSPGTDSVVWEYGVAGILGTGPGLLGRPHTVAMSSRGTILVADRGGERLVEVAPAALAFDPLPILIVGECSSPVTLRISDSVTNAPQVAPRAVTVALSSDPSLTLYSDAACSVPVTSQAFLAGEASHALHLLAATGGPKALSAESGGYKRADVFLSTVGAAPGGGPTGGGGSGGAGDGAASEAPGAADLAVGCACGVGNLPSRPIGTASGMFGLLLYLWRGRRKLAPARVTSRRSSSR